MPVARGTTPAPAVTPTSSRPRAVLPAVGTYEPVWIAPDGTVLPLNPPGAELFSLKANAGLGAVPVEHVTLDGAEGLVVQWTRPKERTIQWPIRMRGATHTEFLSLFRRVTELITMTRDLGPGWLRITRPDGTARQIACLYSSGLEADPEEGLWTRQTATVNWLCPWPFWQSVDPVVVERRQETGGDYLNPYPTFSSGRVFGNTSIANDGAADAWPTWTIRGPMTALTAVNNTSGRTFTVTHTLDVGETITITSRPMEVLGPAGENLKSTLGLLTGGGKPWPLAARTVSDVTFTVTGAEPASAPGVDDATMIRLESNLDYETA